MKKAVSLFCAFVILFSLVGCQKAKVPYTEDWESLIVGSSANLAELDMVTYSDKEWDKIVKDAVSCFSLIYDEQKDAYYTSDSDFSMLEWNKLHPFQYVRENNERQRYEIVYFSKNKALFMYFDNNHKLTSLYELYIVAKIDLDKVEIGKTTLENVCKKIDPSKKGYEGHPVPHTEYAELGDVWTKHYADDGYIYLVYYKFDRSSGDKSIFKVLFVSNVVKKESY